MTEFTKDRQFWTLGGPYHHEFEYMNQHLDFGPGSYHTVDINKFKRPTSDLPNNTAVITYPNTDFWDTWKQWGSVGAISYDSTQTMISTTKNGEFDQSRKIIQLAKLVEFALQNSPAISVHTNWMINYANFSDPIKNKSLLEQEFPKWIQKFAGRFDNCKIFDSQIERMETSATYMVDMHFHVWN